jgi:hypothetical protein
MKKFSAKIHLSGGRSVDIADLNPILHHNQIVNAGFAPDTQEYITECLLSALRVSDFCAVRSNSNTILAIKTSDVCIVEVTEQ